MPDSPFSRLKLPGGSLFTTGTTVTGKPLATSLGDVAVRSDLVFTATAVPVAVDVPTAPPVITRGGKEVPQVQIDPTRFEGIFVPPKPLDEPRVVAQSPPAGTPVQRGSRIDLVVTSAREVPFDVFVDPHRGFKGKTIGAFETVLDDDATRNLLLANSSSSTLTAADREKLLGTLRTQQITVDDNDPQATFERAFQTLRGAAAFR